MKVYLLEHWDYETPTLLGIFTTYEKANAYLIKCKNMPRFSLDGFEISEVELDTELD